MKKLLTLVMLMVLSVGYAWGQTTLFETDFSDSKWSGYETSKSIESEKELNGLYFKCASSVKDGNLIIEGGNIKSSNYWISIPVSNINGKLTATFTTTVSDLKCIVIEGNNYKANYTGTETAIAAVDGKVTCEYTMTGSGTNAVIYFGRSGSKKNTLSHITITTPSKEITTDDATLKSITLDGTPLAGFDPAKTTYDVELPYGTTVVPTIAATATNAKATVGIVQATALPGSATINVTAEDGVTTKEYTINFTVAAASTNNELYQVVFSNSFDGFIRDGKVKAFYMAGTEKPTVNTMKPKHEKASANVSEDGSKIVVTAESGDVAEYDVIVEAVEPYQGFQLIFDGTENWIKTGYSYDTEKGKGWRFSTSVEEEKNKRISQGNNRLYFFVDACTDITLYTATGSTSARNIKVYRNGTELSTPTSLPKYAENANINIAGDENAPCMIAIVSSPNNTGDGGVMSITVNKPAPAALTLNTSGYSTYSNANTVTIEGAMAYTAKVDEANSVLQLNELGTVIPAGQGVLLKGEAGATVTFTYGGEAPAIETNDFKAALLMDEPVAGNVYVLKANKFVKYTGTKLTKNKAYILMSDTFGTGSNARPMSIVFGGDTNGITTVKSTTVADDAPTFNLNGQRVAKGTKGLLIQNGKKLIVK